MLNETLVLQAINAINMSSGAIPIEITTTTNWSQLAITLILSSFFLIFFFGQMAGMSIRAFTGKIRLYIIKRMTNRHVVMIKHTQSSLFSQSMIDRDTMSKIQQAMLKFKGKPFDIILHTPGGEVFSALLISRIIKNYPGEVRAIVPAFSMSGGSLLALSCNKIYMAPSATLGPVDVQLGTLFKFGSAKAWNKIVRFKGRKAEDSSIAMDLMGGQYTKSMKTYFSEIIDFGLTEKQKKVFIDFITNGEVEHAYQLTPEIMRRFGFKIENIPEEALKHLLKLISSQGLEGVTYL